MRSIIGLIFAIIVLLGIGSAWATPSTQIWIPSTDVQGFKVVHFGFDMFLKADRRADGSREPSVINNGLTVGVLPFDKVQAEIGLDYRVAGFEALDAAPLYFNAKVGLVEDALFGWFPAIAVGGFDFGTKKDVTTNDIFYGVLAKSTPIGRFSAGWFVGNDKLLVNSRGEKDNTGLLASWDRTMSEISDKLWLAIDYQGTKSGYGALSLGMAWKFADNVGVIGGYDIWNNHDYKPTVTLQVDIDLK